MSDERVVFLHCINMADYDGYETNIHAGGFKFARENGFGGEMYNFRNVNGRCFGHVEVMPRKIKGILTPVSLDLGHLTAPKDASHIDGVLVIWTAPCRDGKGSEVVGWYQNAILYRDRQYPKGQFKRQRSFKDPKSGKMYYLDYRVEAAIKDCHLLAPDDRLLRIPSYPRSVKGVPGQFPVYYPLKNYTDEAKALRRRVLAFVNEGKYSADPRTRPRSGGRGGRQPDPDRRKEIETAAVGFVTKYFKTKSKLGCAVETRENQNVGYDLFATGGDVGLCIEVKGRSGEEIVADFSPNEFATLLDHQKGKFGDGDYRICIVTDALNERKSRKLHHFSWWPEKQAWINVDGSNQLVFEPKTAAIASITKPKSKSRKRRTLKHHGRNQ